jgi:LAS superfamily LD-carboxypeptidase LdcB
MEQAFSKVFGGGIPINDGWRSYQKQVEAWERYQRGGPKAARPGTSEHGNGIALDLGGAFQNANSAQHRWLQANGARFGWYWTGRAYGEPWHWEYRGA